MCKLVNYLQESSSYTQIQNVGLMKSMDAFKHTSIVNSSSCT